MSELYNFRRVDYITVYVMFYFGFFYVRCGGKWWVYERGRILFIVVCECIVYFIECDLYYSLYYVFFWVIYIFSMVVIDGYMEIDLFYV